MEPGFYQTRMGQKFYQSDVPRIAHALEDIAKELKRANDKKEKDEHDRIDHLRNRGPR